MDYFILIIGFLLLIKGADFFVEGSSGIARVFKVPALIIGLTIVAFGTSAPEAAVSISAALKGSNGISLGNILGSNIFNLSMILGVSALLLPMKVQKQSLKKEIPLTLLSALALFILAFDNFWGGEVSEVLSRGDGLILLLLFAVFVYYIIETVRNNRETTTDFEEEEKKHPSIGKLIIYTLGGIAGIIFGGNLVVNSAVNIAKAFGLSETLIGLTIVAIGTSLPELITSAVAAIKKESDIALGNLIGSNIFNVLFVMGISATLSPVIVDPALLVELTLNILLTLIVLLFSLTGRVINRAEGLALSAFYIVYAIYLVVNNI